MPAWLKAVGQYFTHQEEPLLEDALNSLEMALIYFNTDGTLRTANCRACLLIPELGSSEIRRKNRCSNCPELFQSIPRERQIKTFEEFIAYIFDNSLEAQEQGGLFLGNDRPASTIFREIIRLDDGSFYLVRAVPQKEKGIIVDLTDISVIKSRSDHLLKLDQENKILTEAIQTSRKGIFIADNKSPDQKLIFANQAMGTLLRLDCNKYLGRSLLELLEDGFPNELEQLLDNIKNNNKSPVWSSRHNVDGELVWLELFLFRSGQEGNLLIGFIADQTQSKLQEQRLHQTQKLEAIGHLAGGIAHDFNNILAIIEGYARIAESTWKRNEDISMHLQKIYQAVQRGSGLTKQLLTFGKHRVGEDQTIDLCAQIREVQTLLEPLLGIKVNLHVITEKGEHYIKATPDIVSQIVMNLSINARDAMPDGGTITIEVSFLHRDDRGNGILLRIADTGTGMTKEVMERMFDPFFTTKEQGKGTGLGLSMVYGLVQQMKGEMFVDSELGNGTIFSLWFPEAVAPSAEEIARFERKVSKQNDGDLKGKTVVLAEDEPDLLEIMKETLEGLGMVVLKAANGNEALEVQDGYDGEIDFLLTDMVMPKLDGLKLAELFHEVRPETHVVFMSGYPVRGEISNIDLPEDAVFLAKPIMQENLKKVMEQVAQGKHVQAASGVVWET